MNNRHRVVLGAGAVRRPTYDRLVTKAGALLQRAEDAFDDENWALAAERYAAGLQLAPNSRALYYYRLGLCRERMEDFDGAVEAIAQAITRRRDPPAWWYFKLARGLRRQKRWADAAEAFKTAIERNEQPPAGWFFQLGNCYERGGRWSDAQAAYERGLERDTDVWPIERGMLDREINEWPARRVMLRFINEHIEEIRAEASVSLAGEDRSDVVYTYWAQGFDAAPEIVQRCYKRLQERTTGTVIGLDEPAIQNLIKLPDDIEARGIHPTHRSDLLRLELLARHGGSWLDSTCLVVSDPLPELSALRKPSGYFAFSKRNTTFATWVMSSVPDHYLVKMLRAALHTYWRHHGKLTEYYVLHHIFEALTLLDDEFGRLWTATPVRMFNEPMVLRWKFAEPYDEAEFQQMVDGCFVHKLSYKYEPGEAAPGTVLAKLLEVI